MGDKTQSFSNEVFEFQLHNFSFGQGVIDYLVLFGISNYGNELARVRPIMILTRCLKIAMFNKLQHVYSIYNPYLFELRDNFYL